MKGLISQCLPKKKAVALLILFASSIASAKGFYGASPQYPVVARAHEAYVAGDYKRMAQEVRTGLEAHESDSVIRNNLLALMKNATLNGPRKGFDIGWKMPDSIHKFKVSVARVVHEGNIQPRFFLKAQGHALNGETIQQLQIVKYPNQVILDKQSGVGTWEFETDPKDSYFKLKTDNGKDRIPSGLYLLKLTTGSGEHVDGWFVLDEDHNATGAPALTYPTGRVPFVTSGTPRFDWLHFKTPEFQVGEGREQHLNISRSEPPSYAWDPHWDAYTDTANLTSIDLAKMKGEYVHKVPLPSGPYVFHLAYTEYRYFTNIRIGREVSYRVRFDVK